MNQKLPVLTPEAVIICDDVRREDNGKIILIGVYNNIVLFNAFPALFTLRFWVQCKATADGTVPLSLRILRDKKQKLYKSALDIEVKRGPGDNFGFAMFSPPFEVESPCTLTLKWRQPNKRWQTIKEFVVDKST